MTNTHPLQSLAARAIDRAVGRRMTFLPGGDESKKFNVVGTFSPHPVLRMPDGQMIQSEEPAAFVSEKQLVSLLDAEGARRDPAGGNVDPDYIIVNPMEPRRRVIEASLDHNGYWNLKLSNPL